MKVKQNCEKKGFERHGRCQCIECSKMARFREDGAEPRKYDVDKTEGKWQRLVPQETSNILGNNGV